MLALGGGRLSGLLAQESHAPWNEHAVLGISFHNRAFVRMRLGQQTFR